MRNEDQYHESFSEEELTAEELYNQQLAQHYGYTI
jgi:hypothetical protein